MEEDGEGVAVEGLVAVQVDDGLHEVPVDAGAVGAQLGDGGDELGRKAVRDAAGARRVDRPEETMLEKVRDRRLVAVGAVGVGVADDEASKNFTELRDFLGGKVPKVIAGDEE